MMRTQVPTGSRCGELSRSRKGRCEKARNALIQALEDRTKFPKGLGNIVFEYSGHSVPDVSPVVDFVSALVVVDSEGLVYASDTTINIIGAKAGYTTKPLVGHSSFVTTLAAVDPHRLISGSTDNSLKLWNLRTGLCTNTLIGHSDFVSAVTVFDHHTVVSGSHDRTIKLWNIQSGPGTGTCMQTFSGHFHYVEALESLENRVISGSWDRSLMVWDIESGDCVQTLRGHTDIVTAVAGVCEQQVVSGSYDKTIKLWDLRSGSDVKNLSGIDGKVRTVVVVHEQQVVFATTDGAICSWDLRTGSVTTLTEKSNYSGALAVMDEHRVVFAGKDLDVPCAAFDGFEMLMYEPSPFPFF